MTHLGCFYFRLFLLLGFISNSRRSERTNCDADRTLRAKQHSVHDPPCLRRCLSNVVLPFLKLAKCWTVGPR